MNSFNLPDMKESEQMYWYSDEENVDDLKEIQLIDGTCVKDYTEFAKKVQVYKENMFQAPISSWNPLWIWYEKLDDESVKCLLCNNTFDMSQLKKHLRQFHGSNDGSFAYQQFNELLQLRKNESLQPTNSLDQTDKLDHKFDHKFILSMDLPSRIKYFDDCVARYKRKDTNYSESPVWIFYTRLKDRTTCICLICGRNFRCTHGCTSSLRQHILRFHSMNSEYDAHKQLETLVTLKDQRLKNGGKKKKILGFKSRQKERKDLEVYKDIDGNIDSGNIDDESKTMSKTYFDDKVKRYISNENCTSSPIWIWFMKKTKNLAHCRICKKTLSLVGRSTTFLIKHLKASHGIKSDYNAYASFMEMYRVNQKRLVEKRKLETCSKQMKEISSIKIEGQESDNYEPLFTNNVSYSPNFKSSNFQTMISDKDDGAFNIANIESMPVKSLVTNLKLKHLEFLLVKEEKAMMERKVSSLETMVKIERKAKEDLEGTCRSLSKLNRMLLNQLQQFSHELDKNDDDTSSDSGHTS